MNRRLRAICDLSMSSVREYTGRHEYDGRIEDLSPEGVRAGLARLGGPPEDGPHDDAHLAAFERLVRLELGELELHRSNPLYHIGALDVSCYDRDYAPAAERAEARRRHLAAWPEAVDAAVTALDRVAAPVAEALLPAAQGLTADLDPGPEGSGEPQGGGPVSRPDDPVVERALAAHKRLVAHLEAAAAAGHHDTALGRGRWSGCSAPARPWRSTWAGWRSGPTPSATGSGPCWRRPAGGSSPAGPPPRWWPGSWTTTPTPAGCCPRPRP
jgi:hypothetical protein